MTTVHQGMEAIYEFEVKDMPVTVAVDALGQFGAPERAGAMEGKGRSPGGEDRRDSRRIAYRARLS